MDINNQQRLTLEGRNPGSNGPRTKDKLLGKLKIGGTVNRPSDNRILGLVPAVGPDFGINLGKTRDRDRVITHPTLARGYYSLLVAGVPPTPL